jgi:histidinol-phosphate aminotransferase
MVDVFKLARKNILELQPYSSARDEFSGNGQIFLDANENSYGTPLKNAQDFNRYPDPHQRLLKEKLSALYGIPVEQIFLGNGSDEVIDLLLRVFCEPKGDRLILMPPTYGMYEVVAQINDVPVQKIPLTPEFQIDFERLQPALKAPTKMIFICSPNNPTGNAFPNEVIEKILQSFAGIVVVDEAYIDFAPEKSVLPLLEKYKHLVILRTFSKAWGSAGIRLGMAFSSPETISLLNKIKMPYNVSKLTQEVALELIDNKAQRDTYIAKILQQRRRLMGALNNLSFVTKVFPSDANFILIKVRDAKALYRFLMEKGIIVRDRSSILNCDACLRITVGTESENDRLLGVLKEWEKR